MLVPKISFINCLKGWYKIFKSRVNLYKKCVRAPFKTIFTTILSDPPWRIEMRDGRIEQVNDMSHLYDLVYSYSNPQPSSSIIWDFEEKNLKLS